MLRGKIFTCPYPLKVQDWYVRGENIDMPISTEGSGTDYVWRPKY